MTRLLPALHEGHAPIQLHHAFEDALEAFESWIPGTQEPEVSFDGRSIPISAVFGRMRTCTDLLPQRMLVHVCEVAGEAETGSLRDGDETYAGAAFLLRALCIERLGRRAA